MDFFSDMDVLLKTFWWIALPASLLFVIQTIMTFVGADAGDGLEADFDGDLDGGDHSFQLFSLRNLVNFMLGFGWTGVTFFDSIDNRFVLILLATLIGSLFVAVFFMVIKQLLKLAEDNTVRIQDAVGKLAEVYLFIPAGGMGKGKVQVSIRGSVHEYDAISKGASFATGSFVRIVEIENKNLVIVDK